MLRNLCSFIHLEQIITIIRMEEAWVNARVKAWTIF